jgi:hypothetical protein
MQVPNNSTNTSSLDTTAIVMGDDPLSRNPPLDAENNTKSTSIIVEKFKSSAGTVVPVVLIMLCLAFACAAVLHYRGKHQSAAATAAAQELDGGQVVEMIHNPLCNNANRNAEFLHVDGHGDGGCDGGGYLHVVGAVDHAASSRTQGGRYNERDEGRPRYGISGTLRVVSTSINNPQIMFSIPMEEEDAGVGTSAGAGVGGEPLTAAVAGRGGVEMPEYEEIADYNGPPRNALTRPAARRSMNLLLAPADYAATDGSEQTYATGAVQYSSADGSEEMYTSAAAAPYSTPSESETIYVAPPTPLGKGRQDVEKKDGRDYVNVSVLEGLVGVVGGRPDRAAGHKNINPSQSST